ncbi:TlpA family protein disulfide reductase [Flavobacteriaceae bacterium AH-315-O20]|nr:TlpA family protein disulfide reductase [Flavobacteriaceae bacterium AH-315-O20]
MINPLGDTITLGEVFKRTTQKIKVIDFWASWCPPCITEIKKQEFLNTENQYYLVGGQNSSLGKSLKVSGIPRYVIFDKQGKIILDHAPRPSDSIVFKRAIDDINLKSGIN